MSRPPLADTRGLREGLRVRFIWDYANGKAIEREGTITYIRSLHHVSIAYLSSRPRRAGQPPRTLSDEWVSVGRILEILP